MYVRVRLYISLLTQKMYIAAHRTYMYAYMQGKTHRSYVLLF